MAESWLRVSGAGAAEEAGPEGGLEESNALNDSLTSLQWLQEFSILKAKVPALPSGDTDPHGYHELSGSAEPGSPLAADPACLGQPHTPGEPTSSCTPRSAPSGLQASPPDDVDYATNPHVKPPYSYATLICMAMQASKATKITLSAIYKWITDNFCYFRQADPTWQVGEALPPSLPMPAWTGLTSQIRRPSRCGTARAPREEGRRGRTSREPSAWTAAPLTSEREEGGCSEGCRGADIEVQVERTCHSSGRLSPKTRAELCVDTAPQGRLMD